MADPASDIVSSRQTVVQQKDALLDVRRKLEAISAEHKAFGKAMMQSLDMVRRALDDFGDPPGGGSLAISFNGGKDACVVLYLLLLVLAERDELDRLSATAGEKASFHPTLLYQRIPVVYFEKEEFPEIEDFMREVSKTYGFEFLKYAMSYKDGMQDLVDNHGVKGVIMGQRRGDPWTETMEWFTPSTPGWAKFTRVNPALEWKFCDVWRFLRGSGLPYCVLYDQGYTSLGERGDTAKNEALRLPNGDYRPAYELAEQEEHLERYPRSPSSVDSAAGQRANASGGGATAGEGREGEGDSGNGRNSGVPRALKRISAWDKRQDHFNEADDDDDDDDDNVSSKLGVSSGESGDSGGDGGKQEGSAEVPDQGTFFSGLIADGVPAGGGAGGVPTHLSDCALSVDARSEVVEMESISCLQPEGKGRVVSTSWVGGSARWLPVTVALALVLAAVGGRRSDSPRGGGENVVEGGKS